MCMTMMILATAAQAIGAIRQGNQQAAQAEWQSKQAEADARASREAGEVRAEKVRKAGNVQKSQATAALAASGVEVGAGTPVRIAQEITRDAEADAQAELLTGAIRPRGSSLRPRVTSQRRATRGRVDGYEPVARSQATARRSGK